MDLSEKLKAILSLTSVKNNELAKAVNIDSAQISRLRTGTRKAPRDPNLLRDISDYLASKFNSEFMPSALYDLTHDTRLHTSCNERTLSLIIYDWLSYSGDKPEQKVSHFLSYINGFSGDAAQNTENPGIPETKTYSDHMNTAFRSYTGNEGKRMALKELCEYIISLKDPCTVKIFSDEADQWLIESHGFLRELTGYIDSIAKKGCRTVRVLPPSRNIESTLRDIERWMPAYMAGTIQLFHYPWARDELHRMTVILVPDTYVLFSISLYGQREANTTFLSTDPMFIAEYDSYFDKILERTKSMIGVYTLTDKDRLIKKLRDISQINESGIYKCSKLSSHTLPKSVLMSMSKRGTQFINRVLDSYAQNEQLKFNVLKDNIITDIMSFPDIDSVMRGEEPVPGTFTGKDVVFYTPDEYRQHLEHIIWYLKSYINYRAVFIDDAELNNVVIYTKGSENALLIKENDPFALFEITEPRFAASLADYLKSVAMEKMSEGSRRDTYIRLNDELAKLDAAIEDQRKSV